MRNNETLAGNYWRLCTAVKDSDLNLDALAKSLDKVAALRNSNRSDAPARLTVLARTVYAENTFRILQELIADMPQTNRMDILIQRWFSPLHCDAHQCREAYAVIAQNAPFGTIIGPIHDIKGMQNEANIAAIICTNYLASEAARHLSLPDDMFGQAEMRRAEIEIQDALEQFLHADALYQSAFSTFFETLLCADPCTISAENSIGHYPNLQKVQECLNLHPNIWFLAKENQAEQMRTLGLYYTDDQELSHDGAPRESTPVRHVISTEVAAASYAPTNPLANAPPHDLRRALADYIYTHVPLARDFNSRIEAMDTADACVAYCILGLATPDEFTTRSFPFFCAGTGLNASCLETARSIIQSVENLHQNHRAMDRYSLRLLYVDYALANGFTKDDAHEARLYALHKKLQPGGDLLDLEIDFSALQRALGAAANPAAAPVSGGGNSSPGKPKRGDYSAFFLADPHMP